jgi:hydrogenase maturation protease
VVTVAAAIFGMGNPYRGDDGVGVAVAEQLARRRLPGVQVLCGVTDPTVLLDFWAATPLLVIIDAVTCPAAIPGRVHRFTDHTMLTHTTLTSTHSIGVLRAIALGEQLHLPPPTIVFHLIEVAAADHGPDLSAPVARAVSDVVCAVTGDLGTSGQPVGDLRPYPDAHPDEQAEAKSNSEVCRGTGPADR